MLLLVCINPNPGTLGCSQVSCSLIWTSSKMVQSLWTVQKPQVEADLQNVPMNRIFKGCEAGWESDWQRDKWKKMTKNNFCISEWPEPTSSFLNICRDLGSGLRVISSFPQSEFQSVKSCWDRHTVEVLTRKSQNQFFSRSLIRTQTTPIQTIKPACVVHANMHQGCLQTQAKQMMHPSAATHPTCSAISVHLTRMISHLNLKTRNQAI